MKSKYRLREAILAFSLQFYLFRWLDGSSSFDSWHVPSRFKVYRNRSKWFLSMITSSNGKSYFIQAKTIHKLCRCQFYNVFRHAVASRSRCVLVANDTFPGDIPNSILCWHFHYFSWLLCGERVCSSNVLLTERILFPFENNLPSQLLALPITCTSKVETERSTKRMPEWRMHGEWPSKQKTTDHCLIHSNSLHRCRHRQYAYKVVSFEFAQSEIGVNSSCLMVTSRLFNIFKFVKSQTNRPDAHKQANRTKNRKTNRKCIFSLRIVEKTIPGCRLPLEDSVVRTTCRLHPFVYQIDTAMQTNARLFFYESIFYVSIRVEGRGKGCVLESPIPSGDTSIW